MIFLAFFQAVSRMQTRWNQHAFGFCWGSKLGALVQMWWGIITCSWDFGHVAHWSHVNIAHPPDPSLGSSMANRTCACEQMGCRTFGLSFFFLFCFYCNENTPAIISVFVPYSYLLATFSSSANLNPLDVALHHRSVSNILVTVHDTCFCLFVMVFYRSCFTNQHRR